MHICRIPGSKNTMIMVDSDDDTTEGIIALAEQNGCFDEIELADTTKIRQYRVQIFGCATMYAARELKFALNKKIKSDAIESGKQVYITFAKRQGIRCKGKIIRKTLLATIKQFPLEFKSPSPKRYLFDYILCQILETEFFEKDKETGKIKAVKIRHKRPYETLVKLYKVFSLNIAQAQTEPEQLTELAK